MTGQRDGGWCSVHRSDVVVLIGLCAVVEGHLQAEPEVLAYLSRHLGDRLVTDGAAAGPDEHAVRQVVNDLNHRLRFALGEYPEPPVAAARWR